MIVSHYHYHYHYHQQPSTKTLPSIFKDNVGYTWIYLDLFGYNWISFLICFTIPLSFHHLSPISTICRQQSNPINPSPTLSADTLKHIFGKCIFNKSNPTNPISADTSKREGSAKEARGSRWWKRGNYCSHCLRINRKICTWKCIFEV